MPSAAALDAAHELAALPGAVDVDDQALAILCRVFDIPVGTFNHVTVLADRVDPQVRATTEGVDDVVRRMAPGIRDHPLFELLPSCRDVLRMSDVLPVRRWLHHPLYSDIIGPAGIPPCSVLIPIDVDSAYTFVMLNRDLDFGDDEIRDLTFLQGTVTAVRRRAVPAVAGQPSPRSPLTPREHQVLVLLDAGLTVSAVARQLVMQPRTAAKHIESIHHKLGTADRLSTVRAAIQAGWLAPGR